MSKIVLVTGASSGIGRATALELLRAGHTVYGGARRAQSLDPVSTSGGHALAMDVTDDAALDRVVRTILGQEGRIDVLVNNAGFGLYGAAEDVPLDQARYQLEVNLFGPARLVSLCCRRCASGGRARSSTSPRWAGRSPSRSGPGTTPPSMPSRPTRTRSARRSGGSASTSCSSSPASSRPSSAASPPTGCGRSPDVPVTYMAARPVELPPNWPVKRMQAFIRTKQVQFTKTVPNGRLVEVQSSHDIDLDKPDLVLQEVQRILDTA